MIKTSVFSDTESQNEFKLIPHTQRDKITSYKLNIYHLIIELKLFYARIIQSKPQKAIDHYTIHIYELPTLLYTFIEGLQSFI